MADKVTGIDPSQDTRPLWGTQGGGLAEERNGQFFFVEEPNCPGLVVGDLVPDDWDIVPANTLARDAAHGPCGH